MMNKTKNYLLTTPRLGLRLFMESDFDRFAEMNADPEVMRFFPNTLSQKEVGEYMERINAHYEKHGHCYFATDRLDTGEFIGFIGLAYQDYEVPFCPCTDIGWRLHRSAWGNGFATEGAKACLEYAFHVLNKTEIYATAPKVNLPSIKVMKKIGMEWQGIFIHPKISDEERLRECVFYKISK